jgi:hypothetical protein
MVNAQLFDSIRSIRNATRDIIGFDGQSTYRFRFVTGLFQVEKDNNGVFQPVKNFTISSDVTILPSAVAYDPTSTSFFMAGSTDFYGGFSKRMLVKYSPDTQSATSQIFDKMPWGDCPRDISVNANYLAIISPSFGRLQLTILKKDNLEVFYDQWIYMAKSIAGSPSQFNSIPEYMMYADGVFGAESDYYITYYDPDSSRPSVR